MTASEIETKVRRIIQDDMPEYRWTSEEIKDYLTDGCRALNAIRPETRYVDGLLTDGTVLPEFDNDPIPIDNRFTETLVFYVVYKCYLKDATDTTNQGLAESYLNKFNTKAQL